MNYGKCPAVAPVGVLTDENQKRLGLDLAEITKNIEILKKNPQFVENLRTAFENRSKKYNDTAENSDENFEKQPEEQLYDGFLPDADKRKVEAVRNAKLRELADFHPDFTDERLPKLLLHYKARSFPKALSAEEKTAWEAYRAQNLRKMLPKFMAEMEEVSRRENLSSQEEFILEDLKLWLENVLPESD